MRRIIAIVLMLLVVIVCFETWFRANPIEGLLALGTAILAIQFLRSSWRVSD